MLKDSIPPLLCAARCPPEDHDCQALDPSQRRDSTLDAVKRVLLRESHSQPLLLVFEDLHWVDAETQAVARRPRREPPTVPCCSQ